MNRIAVIAAVLLSGTATPSTTSAAEIWHADWPAEQAESTQILFASAIAVLPRGDHKTMLAISGGRLVQLWDTDRWNADDPAELSGYKDLRFQGRPTAFLTDAAANRKTIFVTTNDGQLAQLWDSEGLWKLDFPAKALHPEMRFQGSPAVFPTDRSANHKVIIAVTSDGRLAQLYDGDGVWRMDFPAAAANHEEPRFQGSPAVVELDNNKKTIIAVTIEGRLAQLWDADGVWKMDFPAEKAGFNSARFVSPPAALSTDSKHNKKVIFALTKDGRLAQFWDTAVWQGDFPAEKIRRDLRFRDAPALVSAGGDKKTVFAVTRDRRLARLWDTDKWNLDFPAEAAGLGITFEGGAAAYSPGGGRHSAYVVTSTGRLAQVWSTTVQDHGVVQVGTKDPACPDKYPRCLHTGHRTDPDGSDGKVDGFLRLDYIRPDGSWAGGQHTSPTGIFGGCSRGTVVLLDANGSQVYARELGVWCVNGRGQPSDNNEGPLYGPPGDFPPGLVARAPKIALVISAGKKEPWPMDEVIAVAKTAAVLALEFFGGSSGGGGSPDASGTNGLNARQ